MLDRIYTFRCTASNQYNGKLHTITDNIAFTVQGILTIYFNINNTVLSLCFCLIQSLLMSEPIAILDVLFFILASGIFTNKE